VTSTEGDAVARSPELHELLREVDRLAGSIIAAGEVDSAGKRVVVGELASAWAAFRAIQILLERHHAEEARMLWRTLLDNTALLMWFQSRADDLEVLALRFYFTGAIRSERIAKTAADNGYAWAEEMEAERQSELDGILAEAAEKGIELKELPHTYQLLEELSQEGLYYWHLHASQLIHATPIGLEQRFRPPGTDGGPVGIALTSDLEQAVQVGILAAETFIGALQSAAALLGWEVERVRTTGNELSGKLRALFFAVMGRADPNG
jgi:hypothetical protein